MKDSRMFYQLMQLSNMKMCLFFMYLYVFYTEFDPYCLYWYLIAQRQRSALPMFGRQKSALRRPGPSIALLRLYHRPHILWLLYRSPHRLTTACNLCAFGFIVRHPRATRHRATPAGILRYSPAAEDIRLAGLYCTSAFVHPTDTDCTVCCCRCSC